MSNDPKHSDAWIAVVKRKAQQDTCELPQDSWGTIAKAAGIAQQRSRGRVVRLWACAAAAAVALVAGIALIGVRSGSLQQQPASMPTAQSAPHAATGGGVPTATQEPRLLAQRTEAEKPAKTHETKTHREKQNAGQPERVAARDDNAAETNAGSAPGLEAAPQDDRCSVPNAPDDKANEANSGEKSGQQQRWRQQGNGYRGVNHSSKQGNGAGSDAYGNTLRLYGNGIILAAASSENSGKVQTVMSDPDGMIYAAPRRTKFSYEHKIPITVGLTFSKRIPYDIELSTGLVYTLMSSDVTAELTGEKFTQRIQFLGIPFGVRWNFWRWRNFSTYVGGEVLGEKVIDAKYGNDKVDVDRLQWSLHGLAGVRYNVGNHVGFYLEPKVSHYMTDLPLTTIRGEHPINLNVQFGVSVQF